MTHPHARSLAAEIGAACAVLVVLSLPTARAAAAASAQPAQAAEGAQLAPTWSLSTADTELELTIVGDHAAIARLQDAGSGPSWNWVPSPAIVPLLDKVWVNGTFHAPHWTYQGATEEDSPGHKVVLTFRTAPGDGLPGEGLTLTQTWWAAPGPGPVEEEVSLANHTRSNLAFDDGDMITADLTVRADEAVTLWRFGRQSVNTTDDPNFNTGVFRTPMTAGLKGDAAIRSTVSNDSVTGPYVLPFVMLDVGAVHGLYFGYERDFGLIRQTTGGDPLAIRSTFRLWNSGGVTVAPDASLPLPGMFYGAYRGDTDSGSNRMKEWFWNNKITPTIKSAPNEPLVELNIATDFNPVTAQDNTEAVCADWFAQNPVARWGIELTKIDEGWTLNFPKNGWSWDFNPKTWPDGMVAADIAHRNGVELSLYMPNRYNHVNLATPEGVKAEEEALLWRYDHWHYDFWRTDGEFETPADYLSHLGFLQVLDDLIAGRPPGYAGRPGFHWENCSAGGSKKSFDLLERQSVMTLEDSGGWFKYFSGLNYLKAYYANSYMICPVQMKDDNLDIPNYPPNPKLVETDAWEKYTYRTGFLGAWMYGFPGRLYPQHIALYKQQQRPILRGADVYHLAGFPFPDGNHWDAFEFLNPAIHRGSVVLLKPLSRVGSTPAIYLKGLDPAGTYTLTFQDRTDLNARYVKMSGASLMAGGRGIAPLSGTPNDYDSEIIWILHRPAPFRRE